MDWKHGSTTHVRPNDPTYENKALWPDIIFGYKKREEDIAYWGVNTSDFRLNYAEIKKMPKYQDLKEWSEKIQEAEEGQSCSSESWSYRNDDKEPHRDIKHRANTPGRSPGNGWIR